MFCRPDFLSNLIGCLKFLSIKMIKNISVKFTLRNLYTIWPWFSGYTIKFISKRSWVQILDLDTWIIFHIGLCLRKCLLDWKMVHLKNWSLTSSQISSFICLLGKTNIYFIFCLLILSSRLVWTISQRGISFNDSLERAWQQQQQHQQQKL